MTALKTAPGLALLLLAAGQSSRMGKANKLLEELEGKPLVRHSAEALIAASIGPLFVVYGHQGEQVRQALEGIEHQAIENPDYAEGLSTSLKAGIDALPDDCLAALVALGDMPFIQPASLMALARSFHAGQRIVVPSYKGRRGNPVILARAFFGEILQEQGDRGARRVIANHPEAVVELELDDPGVHQDIDDPSTLEHYRQGS